MVLIAINIATSITEYISSSLSVCEDGDDVMHTVRHKTLAVLLTLEARAFLLQTAKSFDY